MLDFCRINWSKNKSSLFSDFWLNKCEISSFDRVSLASLIVVYFHGKLCDLIGYRRIFEQFARA